MLTRRPSEETQKAITAYKERPTDLSILAYSTLELPKQFSLVLLLLALTEDRTNRDVTNILNSTLVNLTSLISIGLILYRFFYQNNSTNNKDLGKASLAHTITRIIAELSALSSSILISTYQHDRLRPVPLYISSLLMLGSVALNQAMIYEEIFILRKIVADDIVNDLNWQTKNEKIISLIKNENNPANSLAKKHIEDVVELAYEPEKMLTLFGYRVSPKELNNLYIFQEIFRTFSTMSIALFGNSTTAKAGYIGLIISECCFAIPNLIYIIEQLYQHRLGPYSDQSFKNLSCYHENFNHFTFNLRVFSTLLGLAGTALISQVYDSEWRHLPENRDNTREYLGVIFIVISGLIYRQLNWHADSEFSTNTLAKNMAEAHWRALTYCTDVSDHTFSYDPQAHLPDPSPTPSSFFADTLHNLNKCKNALLSLGERLIHADNSNLDTQPITSYWQCFYTAGQTGANRQPTATKNLLPGAHI